MSMKKLLVLLLSFVLAVSLLSACSKSNDSNKKPEDNTTPVGEEDSEKDSEKEDSTDKNNSEEESDKENNSSEDNSSEQNQTQEPQDDWSWPLPEKKELSFWIEWSNEYAMTPNDLLGIQAIEEATNVHVDWVTVAATDAQEKFGLMIASGDIPDIIRGAGTYYTGGLTKMAEDGISIDLTELVPKCMPTYMSLVEGNEQLQRDTVSDEGKRLAVYTIATDFGEVKGERAWGGLCIRQDWLEIPETIEDWHEALTAFKGIEGCDTPLLIGKNGTDAFGTWVSAFGVGAEFYQQDGVVKYGPAEDGYLEFLKTFRQWYEEGLIDPNFVTNDASFMPPAEYLATGRAGASANIIGLTADVYKTMGYEMEDGFFLATAPYPVQNEGDTPHLLMSMSNLLKEALVVTSYCEEPELACRWLDYWYTKEAMDYDCLGIEGDSYTVDEAGNYALTDSLLEQAETYQSVLATLAARYTLVTSDFGMYNWAGLDMCSPAVTNELSLTWDAASKEWLLPTYMTMTQEESVEYASLYTDIQTLAQEFTVKAITGAVNLESDYEAFKTSLATYGLDKCVANQQAALDRYNAR